MCKCACVLIIFSILECGIHGNGEMEMGSKLEQFHRLYIFTNTISLPLLENKQEFTCRERVESEKGSGYEETGRYKIYTNALNISLREEE